jgi:acyl-CoA reductase-like NAD-dependent aldehyde dehydrogenase
VARFAGAAHEPTERHDDDPRRPNPASSALVGGRWSDAEDGETAIVMSSATGDPAAEVAAAGPGVSIEPSSWRTRPSERHRWRTPFERATVLERVADVIERRRDELADDLVIEHRSPGRGLREVGQRPVAAWPPPRGAA